MTPVVAFGVSKTVVTVGGWFTTRAAVATNPVGGCTVSGSVAPIWRRATAAKIHASGDSAGIRGIAPRIDVRMGDTTRFITTATGDVVVFAETGCAAASIIGAVVTAAGAVALEVVAGSPAGVTSPAFDVLVCALIRAVGAAFFP